MGEEETERSMLGGKGFKGMLGSKTAYLSRSALPKDVDNPKKLRTLSSCMQNAFNELLDKHCVTNELDNGGEMVKPLQDGGRLHRFSLPPARAHLPQEQEGPCREVLRGREEDRLGEQGPQGLRLRWPSRGPLRQVGSERGHGCLR